MNLFCLGSKPRFSRRLAMPIIETRYSFVLVIVGRQNLLEKVRAGCLPFRAGPVLNESATDQGMDATPLHANQICVRF